VERANNKSHWDFTIDQDWTIFSRMVREAAEAVAAERPSLTRVMGGISPIDPNFIRTVQGHGAFERIAAVAVHGFPLDWNHWQIDEWSDRLNDIRAVTPLPLWSRRSACPRSEEVQEFGLRRTAELLIGQAERIHWYSLFDLARDWPATTRHREAEGSSDYRHFYMGLLRENGLPKRALRHFAEFTPALGICQWMHFEDPRLDATVPLDEGSRGEAPAYRIELGGQLASGRRGIVRSADDRLRAIRRDADVLFHAESRGIETITPVRRR
jgi:beta-xylosidase